MSHYTMNDLKRLQAICAERAEIIKDLETELLLLKADHAAQLIQAAATIADLNKQLAEPRNSFSTKAALFTDQEPSLSPPTSYIATINQHHISKLQANELPIDFQQPTYPFFTTQPISRNQVQSLLSQRIPVKLTHATARVSLT